MPEGNKRGKSNVEAASKRIRHSGGNGDAVTDAESDRDDRKEQRCDICGASSPIIANLLEFFGVSGDHFSRKFSDSFFFSFFHSFFFLILMFIFQLISMLDVQRFG